MSAFRALFPQPLPIIGVVHLPPTPDYPNSPGVPALIAHALADLDVLLRQGVDGILIENEHDRPHRVKATPAVVEALTAVTRAVTRSVTAAGRDIVVGCEILLNDPQASLAVAASSGARFIRTDYFVDRMSRPGYGEFDIDPERLVTYRNAQAPGVLIFADVQVKYATMIEPRTLEASARLAALHGADAVVVTGDRTGHAPTTLNLEEAARGIAAAGCEIPVLIGSGFDPQNARSLLRAADGAIVGTALMRQGAIEDIATARLLREVRALRAVLAAR